MSRTKLFLALAVGLNFSAASFAGDKGSGSKSSGGGSSKPSSSPIKPSSSGSSKPSNPPSASPPVAKPAPSVQKPASNPPVAKPIVPSSGNSTPQQKPAQATPVKPAEKPMLPPAVVPRTENKNPGTGKKDDIIDLVPAPGYPLGKPPVQGQQPQKPTTPNSTDKSKSELPVARPVNPKPNEGKGTPSDPFVLTPDKKPADPNLPKAKPIEPNKAEKGTPANPYVLTPDKGPAQPNLPKAKPIEPKAEKGTPSNPYVLTPDKTPQSNLPKAKPVAPPADLFKETVKKTTEGKYTNEIMGGRVTRQDSKGLEKTVEVSGVKKVTVEPDKKDVTIVKKTTKNYYNNNTYVTNYKVYNEDRGYRYFVPTYDSDIYVVPTWNTGFSGYTYSWGYSYDPYFGVTSCYYRPLPRYVSPYEWLLDYTFATVMYDELHYHYARRMISRDTYIAAMKERQALQAEQNAIAINEETRKILRMQVEVMALQLKEKQSYSVHNALNSPNYIFVVSDPVLATIDDGTRRTCRLDAGDLVTSREIVSDQSAETLKMKVEKAKLNNCPEGTLVVIRTADLMEWFNDQLATVEQGLKKLHDVEYNLNKIPSFSAPVVQEALTLEESFIKYRARVKPKDVWCTIQGKDYKVSEIKVDKPKMNVTKLSIWYHIDIWGPSGVMGSPHYDNVSLDQVQPYLEKFVRNAELTDAELKNIFDTVFIPESQKQAQKGEKKDWEISSCRIGK